MHGLILSEWSRLSISTECIVYCILSERGTDGGWSWGSYWWREWWWTWRRHAESDWWQEEVTPTSDSTVSGGWDLPEAKLEAVMRIQAVVTPSSPDPPTSFSDQVSPTIHPDILILTLNLVICLLTNSRLLTTKKALKISLFSWNQTDGKSNLSPYVEISGFTMYSGNGFFTHLQVWIQSFNCGQI